MKVYYSGNFWGHKKYERAGAEIPIQKDFTWGNRAWRVFSAYSCAKGFVIDFGIQIPREEIEELIRKWACRDSSALSEEEQEQLERDSPFSFAFHVKAAVNGRETGFGRMCSTVWHPCALAEESPGKESEALMEYYGCSRESGWRFVRASFPWNTGKRPPFRSLSLELEAKPRPRPGIHFTAEAGCAPFDVDFTHPVTHTDAALHVLSCEAQSLTHRAADHPDLKFPQNCLLLSYTLTPDLPAETFRVTDCAQSDAPHSKRPPAGALRSAASIGIIGGADGPTAIFLSPKSPEKASVHLAYSSVHFDPVSRAEWRMTFYEKEWDDLILKELF